MAEYQEAFEERRGKCKPELREVLDFLMQAAKYAGPQIDPPTYEKKGEGLKYSNPRRIFCTIHVRPELNVGASLAGVDDAVLRDAGFEQYDQTGWFKLRTMPDAVRYVRFMVEAYEA